MTPPPDLYRLLLLPLQETGLTHMLTGGLAAVLYGEPRLTNDVDLVLRLEPAQAARLLRAFPGSEYYVPPLEVVREEAARSAGGHFNILHLGTALRADIYCLGSSDELGTWAMDRVHHLRIGEGELAVAPIEYVILKKLQYYAMGGSDRHLRDIRAMLRLSGEQVDQVQLQHWLDRLGLHNEWRLTRHGEGTA